MKITIEGESLEEIRDKLGAEFDNGMLRQRIAITAIFLSGKPIAAIKAYRTLFAADGDTPSLHEAKEIVERWAAEARSILIRAGAL